MRTVRSACPVLVMASAIFSLGFAVGEGLELATAEAAPAVAQAGERLCITIAGSEQCLLFDLLNRRIRMVNATEAVRQQALIRTKLLTGGFVIQDSTRQNCLDTPFMQENGAVGMANCIASAFDPRAQYQIFQENPSAVGSGRIMIQSMANPTFCLGTVQGITGLPEVAIVKCSTTDSTQAWTPKQAVN